MYKTELYSNNKLLTIGFGTHILASIEACQSSFIHETVKNKTNNIFETTFFVVTTKVYFDQFGRLRVKYKKGTFAYCKSQSIKVPYNTVNCLFEYLTF